MTPDRWQLVQNVFLAALDCAADKRTSFLDEACAGDLALRHEVESLLVMHDSSDPVLDRTVGVVAARLLASDNSQCLTGRTIGAYKVEREIGRGGMGEVYLARDTRLDRPVAIKLLPASFSHDADRVRRFLLEARAASLLNHPNIVTIHEVAEFEGLRFIVSEFIEGKTLRELMKTTEIKLEQALDILTQTASALGAAHNAGIVHRDIKPENIMVRPDGYVKVLDFGLAKLTEQEQEPADSQQRTTTVNPSDASTKTGTVMGTVKYMSPEQARGQKVDHRTDIFSLGVVLYEAITGRAPFVGETPSHTIVQILEREPPPIYEYVANAPAELQMVVSNALRKQREDRYHTVGEMLAELQEIKHELQAQARQARALSASGSDEKARSIGERVTSLDAHSPATQSPESIRRRTEVEARIAGRFKPSRFAVAAALLLIAASVAALIYYYNSSKTDSLAILPFSYMNTGSNAATSVDAEYLSEGVTEALISKLSRLPELKIIAHSSVLRYKDKEIDPQSIGRALGVRTLLAGKLAQRGDSLTISVELIDIDNNSRIWGNQYDTKISTLMTTQSEIANQISNNLRVRLRGEAQKGLAKRNTENAEAYQLYIKGRYYLDKNDGESFKRGLEFFRQATLLDSGYALAYAGMSGAYYGLSNAFYPAKEMMPKAKAAAMQALELDDNLAEAHAALAQVQSVYEWDWEGAEHSFQRALELNPGNALTHHRYAQHLIALGRTNEAFAEFKRAQELDPLSLNIAVAAVGPLYVERRYDEATAEIQKIIQLAPNYAGAHITLGMIYLQRNMSAEALASFEQARRLRDEWGTLAFLGYACAVTGKREDALRILDELKQRAKNEHVAATGLAWIYAGLGEKDQAFAYLQQAFQDHEEHMRLLKVDTKLESLRSDPRFANMARGMNLAP